MMCLAFIPVFQRGEVKHRGVGFSQKTNMPSYLPTKGPLGGRFWCLQAGNGELRAVDKVLSRSMEVRFHGEQRLVRIWGSWRVWSSWKRGRNGLLTVAASTWQLPGGRWCLQRSSDTCHVLLHIFYVCIQTHT